MPTESKIDPALLSSLPTPADSAGPASYTLTPHGSSSFSTNTYKLTVTHPSPSFFFVKTANDATAVEQLTGEFASLKALSTAVPDLCPQPIAHGSLQNTHGGYFLLVDFLTSGSSSSSSSSSTGLALASKLAKLHSTPAPTAVDGKFGFEVPTFCGATRQDNTWETSWPTFFGERRLRTVMRQCGKDGELERLVERTVAEVVPRLLGVETLGEVRPVCVHGDLWSGNAMGDRIFDPSACYAHSEYELGIMKMFGGFGGDFMRAYHKEKPKDEPVAEYDDRVELYMLYHQLNHTALFGGGYRDGAVRSMKSLLRKYGKKSSSSSSSSSS